MESTAPSVLDIGANKRIMLVSDFYYGQFEGDGNNKEVQKTNTTFKCQSCLKVLKNNIRYDSLVIWIFPGYGFPPRKVVRLVWQVSFDRGAAQATDRLMAALW